MNKRDELNTLLYRIKERNPQAEPAIDAVHEKLYDDRLMRDTNARYAATLSRATVMLGAENLINEEEFHALQKLNQEFALDKDESYVDKSEDMIDVIKMVMGRNPKVKKLLKDVIKQIKKLRRSGHSNFAYCRALAQTLALINQAQYVKREDMIEEDFLLLKKTMNLYKQ